MIVLVLLCVTAVASVVAIPGYDLLFDEELIWSFVDDQLCDQHLEQMDSSEFYDANFRPIQGYLKGNEVEYGNFFQCLNIKQEVSFDTTIEGKYCFIEADNIIETIIPGAPRLSRSKKGEQARRQNAKRVKRRINLFDAVSRRVKNEDTEEAEISVNPIIRYGVCIPKSCSVQHWLNTQIENIPHFWEIRCRVLNDKPFVTADYASIGIFSFIGLLVLISTSYEICHLFFLKKDVKTKNSLLSCFSMYGNTKQLFTFSQNSSVLHCLDGIRSISIMWVIIGHTFSTTMLNTPVSNYFDAFDLYMDVRGLIVTAAELAVDTFFFMSGLLLVYTSITKTNQIGFLKNIPVFYLNRYLRMFPVLATGVLLQASIFHRVTDGANWDYEANFVYDCRRYWWTALLHIQNYTNTSYCLPHSWYLAVDFQLHLLSPLVLIWLLGKRRVAWIVLGTVFLLTLITTAVYNYINNFNANLFIDENPFYFKNYYTNTLTRSPPFLVGMIIGYLLHVNREKRIKLPPWFVSLCWATSVALLSSAIYVYLPQVQIDFNDRVLANYINSFNRIVWSISIGWVILACVHGYGGPVNWFLSLTVWKFVAKISFAMYIFHHQLQFITASAVVSTRWFSFRNLLLAFFNDVTLTILLSVPVCVMIDIPFGNLQRMLFKSGTKKPPPTMQPVVTVEKNDNEDKPQKTV